MTPDRKFELQAISAFIDGVLKEDSTTGYIVVMCNLETADADVTSNIDNNELIAVILRSAAKNAYLGELEDDPNAN